MKRGWRVPQRWLSLLNCFVPPGCENAWLRSCGECHLHIVNTGIFSSIMCKKGWRQWAQCGKNSVSWLLTFSASLPLKAAPLAPLSTCADGWCAEVQSHDHWWSKLKHICSNVSYRIPSASLRGCICVFAFLGLTLTREWLISRPTALAPCLVTVAGPLLCANLVRWSSGVWHVQHSGAQSTLSPRISCNCTLLCELLVLPQLNVEVLLWDCYSIH